MNKKNGILLITVFIALICAVFFYFIKSQKNEISAPSIIEGTIIYPLKDDLRSYNNGKPVNLIFYLHGAGCNENYFASPYDEGGLFLGKNGYDYGIDNVFLSIKFKNRFHWASPKATKDAIVEINNLIKKFNVKSVKIVGISMGGSLALNIASNTFGTLKYKLTKVLAVYPIIDFKYTYQHAGDEKLKDDLKKHFYLEKDSKNLIRESSPITYLDNFPSNVELTLIQGNKDIHVPPEQIENYYIRLSKLGAENCKLLKFDSEHGFENVGREFGEAIKEFVG